MNKFIKIFIYSILSVFIVYLAAASSRFLFLRYDRGYTTIELRDTLLPSRWRLANNKVGQALIKNALVLFNHGDITESARTLRIGLAKAPSDRDGLLLLARLHVGTRRPDLAEKVLLGGFRFHRHDVAYVRTCFSFLFANHEDQRALSLADELLQQTANSDALSQIAALAAATACYYRGNYDQAENHLAGHQLLSIREGRLLGAKIEWERGYRALSQHQLRSLLQDFPEDEEIYGQLVDYLQSDSLYTEARQQTLVFQLARPDAVRPRLELLHDLLRKGDAATLNKESATLLHYFSHDSQALIALADFAANTGNIDLARQILPYLKTPGYPHETGVLLAMEAMIVARDYQGALDLAQELASQSPAPALYFLNISNGLQAIAHYGLHDPVSGLLTLNRFMAGSNLRTSNLLAVANRLEAVDAHQAAHATLTRAVAIDPQNQAALTHLIELDIATGNTDTLPGNLHRLLNTRKPSPEILARAQKLLGRDQFLFNRERSSTLEAIGTFLAQDHPRTVPTL
jgi:Tfp pilus assembly protein PilF